MGRKKFGRPRGKARMHNPRNTQKRRVDERVAWAIWQATKKPDEHLPPDVRKKALGLMEPDSPEEVQLESFLRDPEGEVFRNKKGELEAVGYVLFFEGWDDARGRAVQFEKLLKKSGLLNGVKVEVAAITKEDRENYEIRKEWVCKLRINAIRDENVEDFTRQEEKLYSRALRAEEEKEEYEG